MTWKRFRLDLALALMAGLLAGTVLGPSWVSRPSLAQRAHPHPKVLAAEEFQLVDAKGQVRVTLRLNPQDQFVLSLYDRAGKLKGSFELSPEGRPSITIGGESKPGHN